MPTSSCEGGGEPDVGREVTIPPGLLDELLRPVAKQIVKRLTASPSDEPPAMERLDAAGGVTNN